MSESEDAERPSLGDMAKHARGDEVFRCRECGCTDFRVTNRWQTKDGRIRRLKRCRNCGLPVHSTERNDE